MSIYVAPVMWTSSSSFKSGASQCMNSELSQPTRNRTKSKTIPWMARTTNTQTIGVSGMNMAAKGMEDPATMWNSRRQTGGEAPGVTLLSPP